MIRWIGRLRRLKHKRAIYIVVAMLIVGGALYWWGHSLSRPAYGSIQANPVTGPITDTTYYSTLSTSYYNLLYPSDFSNDLTTPPGGKLLDFKFLSIRDAAQQLLSSLEIYVKPMPESVVLDSDYQKYASQGKTYKASNKIVRGETVDIFASKTDRIAIWEHKSLLLILKYYATGDKNLDLKFKNMLQSLTWAS